MFEDKNDVLNEMSPLPHTEDEKGDVTTIQAANGNVITMTEQPKPKFTLQDLDKKLTEVYNTLSSSVKQQQTDLDKAPLRWANSIVQELLSIVSKHINDLEPIDVATNTTEAITTALETEKVAFFVTGVQLTEDGKNVGTSLYTTVFKARKIRDILNAKFAELKVNHEAKLINYPVY
jgi:hypothetical protein